MEKLLSKIFDPHCDLDTTSDTARAARPRQDAKTEDPCRALVSRAAVRPFPDVENTVDEGDTGCSYDVETA